MIDLNQLNREQQVKLLTELVAKLLAPPPPAAPVAPRLLSAADLAQRWGVPVSWVREQYRGGRLKGRKLGKYIRFAESDILDFEASDHAKGLTVPVRRVR